MNKLTRAIELLAAVVTIVAGVTLCYVLLQPRLQPPSRPGEPEGLLGAQIKTPPGTRFGDYERNAIIFVRSTCKYCTDSMPFYRRVMERAENSPGVSVTFVGVEPIDVTVQYLAMHGVATRPGAVHQIESSDYPFVSGTPTVLAIGRDGRLLRLWRGKVDDSGGNEILRVLGLSAVD